MIHKNSIWNSLVFGFISEGIPYNTKMTYVQQSTAIPLTQLWGGKDELKTCKKQN